MHTPIAIEPSRRGHDLDEVPSVIIPVAQLRYNQAVDSMIKIKVI